jgi:hypothetical protein
MKLPKIVIVAACLVFFSTACAGHKNKSKKGCDCPVTQPEPKKFKKHSAVILPHQYKSMLSLIQDSEA